MSIPIRIDSPQANRASRTTRRTLGTSTTGVATTDVLTVVGGSNPLDAIENNALVQLTGVLTGGAGLEIRRDYYITKLSSTTYQLATLLNGPALNFTSDLTSTTTQLTYGLRSADDGRFDDIVLTVA
jgi:hypothetical protein